MKIYTKDCLDNARKDITKENYISLEVLQSCFDSDPPRMIETNIDEKGSHFYDVKILINGEEREPALLANVFSRIDEYVKKESANIAIEKFREMQEKATSLNSAISDIYDRIIKEYDLDKNDYEH